MTPRQLERFLAVYEEGSMSAAARRLRLAQPALSQHIAALEADLGVRLFKRHSRGVGATAEGERLAPQARAVLRRLELIRRDIASPGREVSGEVELAIVASLAPALGPRLLRKAARSLPGVALRLSDPLSRGAREAVERGAVDLGLMPNAAELGFADARPLFEEAFHLVGAPALWRAAGLGDGPAPHAALGRVALVIPDPTHDLRRRMEQAALAAGAPLNVAYEINSIALLNATVQDGLGFAVMPAATMAAAAAQGAVISRPLSPPLTRVQSLVRGRGREGGAAATAVEALLAEAAAELAAE
ncbi:MAG: LysR family transcriptional regulator, partial [Pseudomonadota bacterium]